MEERIKEIKERLHELGYGIYCGKLHLTHLTNRLQTLKELIFLHRKWAYADPLFNDMKCRLHLSKMHNYEDEQKEKRAILAKQQFEQRQRKDEFKKLNTELNKLRIW